MNPLTLVRTELARITATRMGLITLIALMTVPIAYGGLYLWGNNDPYGNLDRVPVALVVDDTGATVDGERESYGQNAADTLVDDAAFDWQVVSAARAADGVRDGTFDFAVTFPTSFSRDLTSAGSETPVQAQLQLTTDDTNSYLSTTLAKQATTMIRASLTEKLGETASRALLDGIADIRSGLVDASDGASQLASGAADAAAGSSALATGTADLAAGSADLASGLATLDGKAAPLPASASALASGAASVSSGVASASTGAAALAAVAGQAAATATTVAATVAAQLTAAGVSPADQAPILAELQTLRTQTGQASGGAAQLAPAVSRLASGAAQVSSGAATLSAQAPALASAIRTASGGATALAAGASDASAGASSLASGLGTLSGGAGDLSTSLAAGVADVPVTTATGRATTAAAIAAPVSVEQTAITEAANYGAGLAPFFLALAAWIGMYALFLLVRPLSRRALTAVSRPIRTTLAGWATPALLGAVQMLALFALVTLALGLDPANPLGLLGFMVLISVTFAAIVLALNVWLGSVGQFLGLLLMIVQLVTAGGTFPWQTLPAPLAFLHQLLPMSHAVDGMRQLIYGGGGSVAAYVLPLVGWLVAALTISAIGARRQGRARSLRQLRPSLLGG